MDKEFYLCYVDGNKAYFTSDWENQWGDDWNDIPYEHNAERPYENYYVGDKSYPIELKELYYEFPNEWVKLPCDNFCNSPYSVEMINRGAVAWVVGEKFVIPAKTTYEDFIKIVQENKGIIYLPLKEEHCCNCGEKLTDKNKALHNMCNECKYGIDWEEKSK